MAFQIPCQCGRKHEVTAAQAGTNLACRCGIELPVPLLSELRKHVGQDPYSSGTVQQIGALLRGGYVPPGKKCICCSQATADVLSIKVSCERPYAQKNGHPLSSIVFLLGMFVSPLWFTWLLRSAVREEDTVEIRGREVLVAMPLCFCERCQHEENVKRDVQQLKRFLKLVPEYDRLLSEYPEAMISARSAESFLFRQRS